MRSMPVEGDEREDALADGALALAPPCGFCDLHALCGRYYGDGA